MPKLKTHKGSSKVFKKRKNDRKVSIVEDYKIGWVINEKSKKFCLACPKSKNKKNKYRCFLLVNHILKLRRVKK